MDGELVATLVHQNFKADVYSLNVPGEFTVVYSDASGKPVEEAPLTGISSYHQREPEIMARLMQLAHGAKPKPRPDQGDSGEYEN
jgi:hypothetical protein